MYQNNEEIPPWLGISIHVPPCHNYEYHSKIRYFLKTSVCWRPMKLKIAGITSDHRVLINSSYNLRRSRFLNMLLSGPRGHINIFQNQNKMAKISHLLPSVNTEETLNPLVHTSSFKHPIKSTSWSPSRYRLTRHQSRHPLPSFLILKLMKTDKFSESCMVKSWKTKY